MEKSFDGYDFSSERGDSVGSFIPQQVYGRCSLVRVSDVWGFHKEDLDIDGHLYRPKLRQVLEESGYS